MPKSADKANVVARRKRREQASADNIDVKIVADMPALDVLERLIENETITGQARVSAARTLLEASGHIGRHQSKPDAQDMVTEPVLLSRDAILRELARLRTRFVV